MVTSRASVTRAVAENATSLDRGIRRLRALASTHVCVGVTLAHGRLLPPHTPPSWARDDCPWGGRIGRRGLLVHGALLPESLPRPLFGHGLLHSFFLPRPLHRPGLLHSCVLPRPFHRH